MPARILIVEQDLSLAENLCEILCLFGYTPIPVNTAEDALAELAASSVDLILADFQLPSMTGCQLIARLRARGQAIPAVLLSDWRTAPDDELARADIQCIAKPLDIVGLLESVGRLLGAGGCAAGPPSFRGW